MIYLKHSDADMKIHFPKDHLTQRAVTTSSISPTCIRARTFDAQWKGVACSPTPANPPYIR